MASAAPKIAADDMPSVNGLASGLFSVVCISAPASESAAPTRSAMTAYGMRTCQTMTDTGVSSAPGWRMARTTSAIVRSDGPVTMSRQRVTKMPTASSASTVNLRRTIRLYPASVTAAAAALVIEAI